MTTKPQPKPPTPPPAVEAPPDESLMRVIPAGKLRTHAAAIAPPGWTPEQVLRALGYTA